MTPENKLRIYDFLNYSLSCGRRMDPIADSMKHSTRFIDNENRKTKPTMGQNKTGK